MEASSVLPCKWCTHLQGLLLTASFLTCCHLPTTAQITIELEPPQVIEGENVLIRVNNLTENLITLAWFRGMRIKSPQIGQYTPATKVTVLGPGHSGRETLYSNGSLQIYNVTQEDIGFYSLRIINKHAEIVSITSIYLNVYSSLWTCEHPSPHAKLTIESVPPGISEGGSVLLLVKNLPQNLLSLFWYKGVIAVKKFEIARHIKATNSSVPGPAHTGRETVFSNGSLLLQEVMQSDTGFYTLRTMSTDLKDEVAHVQLYTDTYLLTCYHPLQVKIESLPQNVAVGKTVLLLVHNLPEDFQAFFWYKSAYRRDTYKIAEYKRAMDATILGSAYSSREFIYNNGSMLIIDVTEDDAGYFLLEILREDLKIEKAYIQLHVNSFVSNSKDSASTARLSIESVPPSIVEGGSVLLLVHNLPKNLQSLFWYKGMIAEKKSELIQHIIATSSSLPGPAHSGRETVYNNGSLLLQRVMQNDTQFYTLQTMDTDLKYEVAHVQLQLDTSLSTWYHPLQVKIESLPQNVAVGKSVLFLVHNFPEVFRAFSWYKPAYKSHTSKIVEYHRFTDSATVGAAYRGIEVIFTNGSMVMIDVTEDDAGFYMLEILREDFKVEKAYVQLHVNSFVPNSKVSVSTARLSIESVPPSIVGGESVLLLVHNLPKNLQSLFWYKGVIAEEKSELIQHIIATSSSLPGPAHSGRETVYSNGSLLLQRVMQNDTGFYTLLTMSTDLKDEIAHVQLQLDTSTCCSLLTSDQLIIVPVPRNIAVGKSVLLLVCNVPKDVQTIFWYKSVYRTDIFKIAEYSRSMESTIWGLAHSGKEMVYTNGSLLIQNVTEHDAGLYMLEILHKDYKLERAHVQVHVNNPVSWPFVRVTDTTVRVQSSVVFTCFSADPGVSIRWLFNKQSLQLTERMTLSPSKCQLSIDPVWREDAGKYQCEVSNPVSSKSSLPVRLAVIEE